jgi:hypothetical protein
MAASEPGREGIWSSEKGVSAPFPTNHPRSLDPVPARRSVESAIVCGMCNHAIAKRNCGGARVPSRLSRLRALEGLATISSSAGLRAWRSLEGGRPPATGAAFALQSPRAPACDHRMPTLRRAEPVRPHTSKFAGGSTGREGGSAPPPQPFRRSGAPDRSDLVGYLDRHQRPVQFTTFTGIEHALEELRHKLSTSRLLT